VGSSWLLLQFLGVPLSATLLASLGALRSSSTAACVRGIVGRLLVGMAVAETLLNETLAHNANTALQQQQQQQQQQDNTPWAANLPPGLCSALPAAIAQLLLSCHYLTTTTPTAPALSAQASEGGGTINGGFHKSALRTCLGCLVASPPGTLASTLASLAALLVADEAKSSSNSNATATARAACEDTLLAVAAAVACVLAHPPLRSVLLKSLPACAAREAAAALAAAAARQPSRLVNQALDTVNAELALLYGYRREKQAGSIAPSSSQ
jgi:hypothetical protein